MIQPIFKINTSGTFANPDFHIGNDDRDILDRWNMNFIGMMFSRGLQYL